MLKHPRSGRSWSAEEDADLCGRSDRGDLLPEIARALGRSQEACRTRANLLGCPVRSSPGRGRRALPPPVPLPELLD